MTSSEDRDRSGRLSDYAWYLIPLFPWYLFVNLLESWWSSEALGAAFLVSVLLNLLIGSAIDACVFGGIHGLQTTHNRPGIRGFLASIRSHYWRMLVAYLIYTAAYLVLGTVLVLSAGPAGKPSNIVLGILVIPLIAVSLFWYAAIVADRSQFRSLARALRTLISSPLALGVGLGWGALAVADNAVAEQLGQPGSLAVHVARAAVLAGAKIVVAALALTAYKRSHGETREAPAEAVPPTESAAPGSAHGVTRAAFGFAFLSFVPLLNFVPLILGIISIRRSKQVTAMSGVACGLGGFFTAFYSLLLVGALTAGTSAALAPGVAFLADANPSLKPHVALFEQGSYEQVLELIEQEAPARFPRHWAFDCASGIAKYGLLDDEGAVADLRVAINQLPTGSGCYYYYGLALLDAGQVDAAKDQFEASLLRAPKLEAAEQQLALIKNISDPSAIWYSVMLVVILVLLFTVHEYAHARAAWKLGDDTAKEKGRLTLNPIPHLSLIGSVLLPGILLWQHSPVIFGWAKPTPVNPEKFKDPQKDEMRVSFAGPAVNALVAMLCFILLGAGMLVVRWLWPDTVAMNLAAPSTPTSLIGPPFARGLVLVVVFLKELLFMSVVLGVFNLIPIPPLDGSWILSGMLPTGIRKHYEKTRRFGFVLLMLLSVTPLFDKVLMLPLGLVWLGLHSLFSAMGLA